MIEKKKSKDTIQSYVKRIKLFEKYLVENKNRKLENALKSDLVDFTSWGKENDLNVYQYFWGIRSYYEFISII